AIGGIDLSQSQDLAHVLAGVEPLLLEALVICLGIRCDREEAHHQALFAGTAALSNERLGVLRILDVLVTAIAALMTVDELGLEIDADKVGIGFNRQSARRV